MSGHIDNGSLLVGQPIRRIAIIRALHIGDLLQSVPALRSIRAGFPRAEITLVGLPWATWFVQRFGHYIDRLVEFPGYPGMNEVDLDAQRTERFLAEQRAYGYDLTIQMHGSGNTSNPFALEFRSPLTVGHFDPAGSDRLTIDAPYPGDLPEVLRNLNIARLLGCPDLGSHLELPLIDEDVVEAKRLLAPLSGRGPYIGIHAGARAPARRWMPERFAAVADHLAAHFGATIILTGGPGEEQAAMTVAKAMRAPAHNLAGRTTLGGLAALIQRLDLFISNDTGPAHIAAAIDTPSLRIFGPADPDRWAPRDYERHPLIRQPVDCSPCPHWECPIDHRCLTSISAKAVIAIAEDLLMRGAAACAD